MMNSRFETAMTMAADAYISRIDGISRLTNLAVHARQASKVSRGGSELAHLDEDQRNVVATAFQQLGETLQDFYDGGGAKELKISIEDPEVSEYISRNLWRMVNESRQPPMGELLSRSTLSLIVTEFEYLLAQLVKAILSDRPELLGDDQTLTLKNLEALGSIEAARAHLIEAKTDGLLKGGLADWKKFFDKTKVKWTVASNDWPAFAEVFARRNVYTHSGGTATPQYRDYLRNAGCDESAIPSEETLLELSDAYISSSIERLMSSGFLLATGLMLQLKPDEDSQRRTAEMIAARVSLLVELRHFPAVRQIAEVALKTSRGRMSQVVEMSLKISAWTAGTHLNGTSGIRKEVEGWDVGGLDLMFAHAKSVLLEDWNTAVREVNELHRRGQMTAQKLLYDPLYSGLVATRRDEINLLNGSADAAE